VARGYTESRSRHGVWVSRMKSYLFVMRHLPHFTSRVQETLDQMLTTAAFDQTVSVLFIDDGVFQLKQGQDPENMALKNTAAMFLALEMYEINNLYVEAESLAERGLSVTELILPAKVIPRESVSGLLKQQDVAISD